MLEQTTQPRRICQSILFIIICAVVSSWAIYYVGLKPVSQFKFNYPHIGWFGEQLRLAHNQDGYHGIDFSAQWQAGRDMSEGINPYYLHREGHRYMGRRWNTVYHPFSVFVHVPISLFSYRNSLLISNIMQILLFVVATFLVIKASELKKDTTLILCTLLSIIFMTQIGLLNLERGQFSLYSASAYLFLWLAIYHDHPWAFVPAALCALMKVSSVPFMTLFWLISVFFQGTQRNWSYAFPGILAVCTLIFLPLIPAWSEAVASLENDSLAGPTLLFILPPLLAKILPLLLTILVLGSFLVISYINRRRMSLSKHGTALFKESSFLLAVSIACVATVMTTRTHEYRALEFIAFLPCLLSWLAGEKTVDSRVKEVVAIIFCVFFLAILRVPPFAITESHGVTVYYKLLAMCYLSTSILFFGGWLFLLFKKKGALLE